MFNSGDKKREGEKEQWRYLSNPGCAESRTALAVGKTPPFITCVAELNRLLEGLVLQAFFHFSPDHLALAHHHLAFSVTRHRHAPPVAGLALRRPNRGGAAQSGTKWGTYVSGTD